MTKITVEHIKHWYNLSHTNNEDLHPEEEALVNWYTLVDLIQRCIRDCDIPHAFSLGILVLFLKKSNGDVRGIGLLEVIHKLIFTIINSRLNNSLSFHDSVHGFRINRGSFTSIGGTKIEAQKHISKNHTLYQVFVDLRKAYDSIDRPRVLMILERYGVGRYILRYIKVVLERQGYIVMRLKYGEGALRGMLIPL